MVRSRELCEFRLIQNDDVAVPGSICVAVYRPDPVLLERQISSIQNQTERGWNCHIGIDGADEPTAALLQGLIAGDDRFVVHAFPENVGFYRNFERVLEAADAASPWIALADQDDYWYPEKIERLLSALMVDGVTLVSGQARLVSPDGVESGITARHVRDLPALMLDNQVTGSFSIFRSSVLSAALPFPEPTDVAFHDHWLGVVAESLGNVVVVDEVLQDYIQHGNNVIGEENGGAQVAKRFSALFARSKGVGASIRYIRDHRWGWRVEMAELCIERIPAMGADKRRVLDTFAARKLSPRLIATVVTGIARRDVKPLRGLALLVGAAAS